MSTPSPTVFIIDDEPPVRHSLARLLESAGYRSREFESAEAFLAEYHAETPGCLLLDVRMPGMSGVDLQRRLREQDMRLPVIIVTGHADVPMAVSAMKNGAVDFIEKPFEDDHLLACVSRAIELDAEARAVASRTTEAAHRLAMLSPREREVLNGLAAGSTVDQIAADIGISPKTVYMHRSHLMHKLGSDSVVDLVKIWLAAKNG